MEVKKNPKANLENYTKLLMLLGLVFSLFVVYQGIEWKTVYKVANLGERDGVEELEEEIPLIDQKIEQAKPPPPPPPPPPAPEEVVVVEDEKEIEEVDFETDETDEAEEVEVEVKEVEEIVEEEEEEEVIEDIPFSVIENVPVFPGCTGNNAELKACMQKKITKHVNRKFNTELATDLGLSAGKKRISVQFLIDQHGRITDVKARAPHPRLQKEALRVINLLPQMKPGKQRNKAVRVRYNLPIVFQVED